MTVGVPAVYTLGCTLAASNDKPRNIAPSVQPMITSVWRAFFHDGSRNAGTPLEIASTPVTAAPPDANALSMTNSAAPRNRPSPGVPGLSPAAGRIVETGSAPALS